MVQVNVCVGPAWLQAYKEVTRAPDAALGINRAREIVCVPEHFGEGCRLPAPGGTRFHHTDMHCKSGLLLAALVQSAQFSALAGKPSVNKLLFTASVSCPCHWSEPG